MRVAQKLRTSSSARTTRSTLGTYLVLERPVRVGDVEAGDAPHRRAERQDPPLGQDRRHLGAEARGARRFVNDHRPAGLCDRVEHRVLVERHEGSQIEDLHLGIAALGEAHGGGRRHRQHRAVGDHGRVGPMPGGRPPVRARRSGRRRAPVPRRRGREPWAPARRRGRDRVPPRRSGPSRRPECRASRP